MFTDITVHRDVSVRSGGALAVAFRKENPKLRGRQHVLPSTAGRRLPKHHRTPLPDSVIRENAAAEAERQKFQAVVEAVQELTGAEQRRLPAYGGAGGQLRNPPSTKVSRVPLARLA